MERKDLRRILTGASQPRLTPFVAGIPLVLTPIGETLRGSCSARLRRDARGPRSS